MLRQPTLDLLHELRLSGMARAFEEQTAMSDIGEARNHRLGAPASQLARPSGWLLRFGAR